VLKMDAEVGSSAMSTQFSDLISGPLSMPRGIYLPIVLVIDALDERLAPSDLLSVITRWVPRQPPVLKFLIISRPEHDLRIVFDDLKSITHQLSLNNDENTNRDIAMFVNEAMPKVARRYSLAAGWPGVDDCSALVAKASGLFVWISTAIKFIDDREVDDPEAQLRIVLDSDPHHSSISTPWDHLDVLYLQVLNQAISSKATERRLQLFRKVVGTIVVLRQPCTALAIGSLLWDGDNGLQSVTQIVRKLQSVLIVPTSSSEPIQVIHPSFIDFITNATRCLDSRFLVQPGVHHKFLVSQSLEIMHKYLKRNICVIDADVLNSEIEDLADRINRYIPQSLQYACKYWANHLSAVPPDPSLCTAVRTFYFEVLLLWLEVSSLLGSVQSASQSLDLIEEWLLVSTLPLIFT
jgi:hypothetical protein